MTFLKKLFIVVGAIECVIAAWRPTTILLEGDQKYDVTVLAVKNKHGESDTVQLVPMVYTMSRNGEPRVLVNKSGMTASDLNESFEFFGLAPNSNKPDTTVLDESPENGIFEFAEMPPSRSSVITRRAGKVKYDGSYLWAFDVIDEPTYEQFRPAKFAFSTTAESGVTTDDLNNLVAAYYEVVEESAKLILVNLDDIKESQNRTGGFSSKTEHVIPIGAPVFKDGDFVGMIIAQFRSVYEILPLGTEFLEETSLKGA